MRNKIVALFLSAILILTVFGCVTKDSIDSDPAVGKGVAAWNSRGPASATAYWDEIKDAAKKKKWLSYVTIDRKSVV